MLVTLGQSNAANHGAGHYAALHDVANFNLYVLRGSRPATCASGQGGNFATRLGDKLIERGLADAISIQLKLILINGFEFRILGLFSKY
jgi:hypothetical protein